MTEGKGFKVTVMEGEGEGDTKAVFLEPKVPGKGVLKDRAKSPKDSVPILRSSTVDICVCLLKRRNEWLGWCGRTIQNLRVKRHTER